MQKIYSEFQTRAMEKVKRLWHLYLTSPDSLVDALDVLPANFLMIGTGRHEFYKSREAFLSAMTEDRVQASDIQFELPDEWYDVQEISEDICIVYGSIWAREKSAPGKDILVDMEGSRFTVVCRDLQTDVEILSIHHSMPYIDQGEDEYYPKTLALLANEVMRKNRVLEHRVEMDHMTELYNRVYFERHVSNAMQTQEGHFFALDLDGFKDVNDSKGHLTGDKVLQAFAQILRRAFTSAAIIGRMGGDEFAVWDCCDIPLCMKMLSEMCQDLSNHLGVSVSCSVGIAQKQADDKFLALYQRADKALYRAKSKGKGCFCQDAE